MSQIWQSKADERWSVIAYLDHGLMVCTWLDEGTVTNDGFSCSLIHLETHFRRVA